MTEKEPSLTGRSPARWLLTGMTAGGLVVDSYVHWHLAPNFDTLVGTWNLRISQGQLFRVEAAVALVAAVLVLATRHRLATAFAVLVSAAGLGAVLLYRYVDVGSFGPLPDMYDPLWYTEKTVSAVAEAVAVVAALWLLVLPHRD